MIPKVVNRVWKTKNHQRVVFVSWLSRPSSHGIQANALPVIKGGEYGQVVGMRRRFHLHVSASQRGGHDALV
jgi:hypothetical protein